MRARLLFVLVVATLAASGARAEVPAPASWRAEHFDFPLVFAPSLPYEGEEQVRFSPDWAHFEAEDGFSYVVLWNVKPALLEAAPLERALSVYFDGLMNNVAIARKLEAMVPETAVVLHPLAPAKGWAEGFAGTVHTWNAFSRAQPLVLNLEIMRRPCGAERMQVFYALSKAPRAHPTWQTLRRIRDDTTCAS